MTEIYDKLIRIDKNSDANSKYYGRLVKWRTQDIDEWHYGIGLSNRKVFDTGQGLNILTISFPLFIVNINRQNFSQVQVIERLKYALLYFSKNNILFDKQTWNDEHYARLIASDQSFSSKVKAKNRVNKTHQKKFSLFLGEQDTKFYIYKSQILISRFWGKPRFWVFCLLLLFGAFLSFIIFEISNLFSPIHSWVSSFAIAFLIGWLIFHLADYEWSGFQNQKLWNWLELLVVPLILTTGIFYLQYQAGQRQIMSDEIRKQQEALKAYFNSVEKIVQEASKEKGKNDQKNLLIDKLTLEDKSILEALTKLILSEIDKTRKSQVVEFLYNLKLINCRPEPELVCNAKTSINMQGANLSESNLAKLNLSKINFQGTNLKGADLSKTNFNRS